MRRGGTSALTEAGGDGLAGCDAAPRARDERAGHAHTDHDVGGS